MVDVPPWVTTSRKHVYIITPLNPTLHSKTGIDRGIHYFSLFLLRNIDYGYSLEPPRVPTIYVLSRNMKNISEFLSKTFQFLVVKFSIFLNRHVFVMTSYMLYPTPFYNWSTQKKSKSFQYIMNLFQERHKHRFDRVSPLKAQQFP